MTEIESRVARCFSNVFPQATKAEILTATPDSLAGWDSIANITLLSALAEEFGMELDLDFMESATSFDGIVRYIEGRV